MDSGNIHNQGAAKKKKHKEINKHQRIWGEPGDYVVM